MNARNEKTRREAGSSEALGVPPPWTSGNSFWRKQLPKHPFSLAASSRIVQAKSRQNPVTVGRSHWRFGVSPGIGFKSLLPWGRCGRAERGDSAHGPIAQRRTPAQTHTQAGMKRQARRPLNRIRSHRIGKVWYRVGVLYRSEQRGGRRPETASKSDSPIMVAQAYVVTLKMT